MDLQRASVMGKKLTCPVCASDLFRAKQFMVPGKWLQVLDLEGCGEEGLLLICGRCTHVLQFADKDAVVVARDLARRTSDD